VGIGAEGLAGAVLSGGRCRSSLGYLSHGGAGGRALPGNSRFCVDCFRPLDADGGWILGVKALGDLPSASPCEWDHP
jgi:hypothetical protein